MKTEFRCAVRAALDAHHSCGYDNADRVTSVVTNDSLGTPQTAFTYQLDGVANRTQVSDYVGGVTQYSYSPRNELGAESLIAAPIAWVPFTLDQWVAFTLQQWVDFVLDAEPVGTATSHTTTRPATAP